jgi:hypothetical protein
MTKDEIENKRLLKTYGISLEEYWIMHTAQRGSCAICHAWAKTRKLNVDHDHAIASSKIVVQKSEPGVWSATVGYQFIFCTAPTRKEVRALAKHLLLRRSVRGLVCHRCNRGLQMFSDSPERLLAAAEYVQNSYDRIAKCQP